jgi:hypothetical protein
MMDPFHRWNYLCRAKYSSAEVVEFMRWLGFRLISRGGVLFWPYREWLANSAYSGKELGRRFAEGERLLNLLGAHFWADYKVLEFVRNRHDRS